MITRVRPLKEMLFIFLIILSLHGQTSSRVIELQPGITKLTHPPNTIPDGQTDGQTNEQTDGQTDGQTAKQIDGKIHGQTDQKQLKDDVDKGISTEHDDSQMSELSIDQVIALASRDDSGLAPGRPLWQSRQELDMWLTQHQSDVIHGATAGRHRRKAHSDLATRWTDNKVIYRRLPNAFSSSQWSVITSAMQEFERLTCLTFHEDTDRSHTNYVYIVSDGGCTSYVGMTGGRQMMTLGDGCVAKSVVLHEIGHAIGFFHEHSRPDRDAYIRVKYENVEPSYAIWFDKRPSYLVNLYDVPYDFNSVMHYYQYAWSANNKVTIQSIDPAYQGTFGFAGQLSFYDVMLANRMYQCDARCDPSVRCPDQGYKGKDCKCYCKGYSKYTPVRECGEEDSRATRATSSPPQDCKDLSAACGAWLASSKSLCTSHHSVKELCPKSCDLCGLLTTPFVPPTTSEIPRTTDRQTTSPKTTTKSPGKTTRTTSSPPRCKDMSSACGSWVASSRALCTTHPSVMKLCPKSCDLCGFLTTPFVPPTTSEVLKTTETQSPSPETTTESPGRTTTATLRTTTTSCYDDLMSCSTLVDPRLDNCATNDNVRKRCRKSCGLCDGDRSTAGVTMTTMKSTTTTPGRTTEARTTRRDISQTTRRDTSCTDGSRACFNWARAGVCRTDINVQKLCPRSCNMCA